MVLESIFAFVVGLGIGAYNHEHLRPCLSDTTTVAKQKGVPYLKRGMEKTVEAAQQATPYIKQASTNLKDRATPYLQMAKDKVNNVRK
mmetsp:Transcript_67228/g.179057  ORF Transcript_67228/g.179057 Transcript_67228/m.179057 type:complete len:88 (+) Transcript_67228:102-365(+)